MTSRCVVDSWISKAMGSPLYTALTSGRRRLPVEVVVPEAGDFDELDRIIYGELCQGEVREASRATLLRIAKQLRARGAQAIVLGSSELVLLLFYIGYMALRASIDDEAKAARVEGP